MDAPSPSTGQPFSVDAPLRQPAVIVHFTFIAMAFFGCYPLAIILGTRHRRRLHLVTIATGFLCAVAGLVAGWASSVSSQSTALAVLGYSLVALLLIQTALGFLQLRSINMFNGHRVHWALGWIILLFGYAYLVTAAAVFTESCTDSRPECFIPITMGSGFLLYGTIVLLHLTSILSLPRSSTPEYYEGILLTVWGAVCFIVSDTPIIGSEWRALNVGLLWFTGGLFSICVSVQTWIPALRERNVVNALVMSMTGRAIIAGFTHDDPYASELHHMLGYMLIGGSTARAVQILFRASPADNLPRMLARLSGPAEATDDAGLEFAEGGRSDQLQSTYRQLTGQPSPCKHTLIFASITVVSGLLVAFLAMAVGVLFMGANVQWVDHARYYIKDPSTFVNATLAAAFLWASYVLILSTLYKNMSNPASVYEYLGLSNLDSPEQGHFEEPRRQSLLIRTALDEQPAMRPSQYRAKRRSLLVQSPAEQKKKHRSLTVGGVLPDEYQTWSNGSGTSLGSPTSFGSVPSTITSPSEHRRTTLFTAEPVEDDLQIRKTKRGRRKTRHRHRDDAADDSDSSSSEAGPAAKYYSNERTSSDSHV